MAQRRGGIIYFKINGALHEAKGNYTYNFGAPKREAIIGSDGVHGFKEIPQVSYIEGEITDRSDLDVEALVNLENATATLELANGKIFVLRDCWYAGDGNVQTEEGNIQIRLEGKSGEEIA